MSVLENSVYWLLTVSPFVFAAAGEAIDDSKEYWQYLFLLFTIVSFLILITNFGRYFYSKRYGADGGSFVKGAFNIVKGKVIREPIKEKELTPFWKTVFFPGYLLRRLMLPNSFILWILSSLVVFVLFALSVESTFRNTADYKLSQSIPAAIGLTIAMFILFYLISFQWQIKI